MARKKKPTAQDKIRKEYLDPTPVEIPVGFSKPEPLRDQIKRLVQNEFSMAAENSDMETFEEADDFEIEDDDDMMYSPYEFEEMSPEEGESISDPLGDSEAGAEQNPRTDVEPDTPNTAGEDIQQSSPEPEATT